MWFAFVLERRLEPHRGGQGLIHRVHEIMCCPDLEEWSLWADGQCLLPRRGLGPARHALLTTDILRHLASLDVDAMLALVPARGGVPALGRPLSVPAARKAREREPSLDDLPLWRARP